MATVAGSLDFNSQPLNILRSPWFYPTDRTIPVPTVSEQSQTLLAKEILSQQESWAKGAFSRACSIADRAKKLQDLEKEVDPKGSNLVMCDKRIAILNCIVTAAIITGLAALNFYLFTLISWFAIFFTLFATNCALVLSYSLVSHVRETFQRTNDQQLKQEWRTITFQKHDYNTSLLSGEGYAKMMKVLSEVFSSDMGSDNQSLQQARQELLNVWNWIREP